MAQSPIRTQINKVAISSLQLALSLVLEVPIEKAIEAIKERINELEAENILKGKPF